MLRKDLRGSEPSWFDLGGRLPSSATKYEAIVRLNSRIDVQFGKVLVSVPNCPSRGRINFRWLGDATDEAASDSSSVT